jgi:hypothetical protein
MRIKSTSGDWSEFISFDRSNETAVYEENGTVILPSYTNNKTLFAVFYITSKIEGERFSSEIRCKLHKFLDSYGDIVCSKVDEIQEIEIQYEVISELRKITFPFGFKKETDDEFTSISYFDETTNTLEEIEGKTVIGDVEENMYYMGETTNALLNETFYLYMPRFYRESSSVQLIKDYECFLTFSKGKGYSTNYKRAITLRDKKSEQAWYNLDKGTVSFVGEFGLNNPNYNIRIKEMMLCNGPRVKDAATKMSPDDVLNLKDYKVVPFSIVRIFNEGIVKDVNTVLRVTWTITLQDKSDVPFTGGTYSGVI